MAITTTKCKTVQCELDPARPQLGENLSHADKQSKAMQQWRGTRGVTEFARITRKLMFLQELRQNSVFSNPSGGNRPWRIQIRRREHEAKSSTPQSKAVQCQVKQYKAKRNKPNPISSYLGQPESRVESPRATQISGPNPPKQAILLQKK